MSIEANINASRIEGDLSLSGSAFATSISATTFYSGGTSLTTIISDIVSSSSGASVFVQPGSNIITGGTTSAPRISLISSPSLNALTLSGNGQFASISSTGLSANTVSGGTFYSGSTPLQTIIQNLAVGGSSTLVQPGFNIYTGGTSNAPTINMSAATLVTLSAGTVSGGTIFSGATNLNTYFGSAWAQLGTKANLSGATFNGSISAITISGGTLFSGATNLYSIFQRPELTVNNVNAGSNIVTGGTAISPILSITASPSLQGLILSGAGQFAGVTATSISGGTISGGTIFSGATNLNTYFGSAWAQLGTKANLSGATFTGPITATTITATTISGGTLFSGATNLYSIFQGIGAGGSSTLLQPGFNTYTGGTSSAPTVNVSAATLVTLSAGTVSGDTFYSGGTPLQTIIQNLAVGGSSTFVQPGFNTYTGGTSSAPTVNVSAATLVTLSAGTVSGGTLFSGATNLNVVFANREHVHYGGIGLNIDNGSSVILSGIKGYVTTPFSGRIVSYDVFSNVAGEIAIDVWKTNYASFPPLQGNSITGSEPIVLTGTNKNSSSSLSSWTKDFNVGDVFAFNVISATTVNRVNIVIKVIKYN